jgi:hypothetical protein
MCRAVGRVLRRLAVGVVLVGRMLRDCSRGGELGGHGGSFDGCEARVSCYTVLQGDKAVELIRAERR